jgi:O-antigen/teichoic acid export membrane protein
MSSVRRRILENFGASALGRILSIAVQVVSVPVLIHRWGTPVYGEWILLASIPTYFAMSDIGFGNVAGNEMTMLVAVGKRDEALDVFQSVSLFITAVSLLVGILLVAGVWLFPLERWLQIHRLSIYEARLIILILGFSSLLTLQEGLFHGSFRCVGKYALGTAAKSAIQLSTFVAFISAVALGARPVQGAIAIAAVNALGTVVLWWILRGQIEWIRYGVDQARISTIKRLLGPAVSFMSFPITNIISLQGILMVVGHAFGPVGVVTFSTARTISRSVLQSLQLINASVWPEISAAFGSGSMALVRRLHRTSCQFSFILCLSTTLLVAVFGNHVWSIWTLGKLQTDPILLDILLVQMLLGAFWYTSAVVPAATNNHEKIARAILYTSCLSLVFSYFLMKVPFLGLRGAAVALVIGDLLAALVVVKTSLRLVEDNFQDFCQSMFEFPKMLPRKR